MKIKSRRFTPEQVQFIVENNKGVTLKELTKLFNDKFQTDYSERMFRYFRHNHGLNSGLDGRFQKGGVPRNKGKKQAEYMSQEMIERTAKTRFKKGNVPKNHRPVGSTRIDSKDGYLIVKTAEPNKWEHAHRVLWKKHYGEIPPKYKVIFLNGDITDIRIENLACVSFKELLVMNRLKLISEHPEYTEAGIQLAKLTTKINDAQRRMKEK